MNTETLICPKCGLSYERLKLSKYGHPQCWRPGSGFKLMLIFCFACAGK